MRYLDYDTRLAAYALIIDDRERVLLALWNESETPLWTMPGGGVEYDETPEAATVRELREETGYEIELGRLLGVDTHTVPVEERTQVTGRAFKGVRLVYDARIVGGDLTNEVDGTTDEARWFPIGEVPDLARVPLVDIALRMRPTPAS